MDIHTFHQVYAHVPWINPLIQCTFQKMCRVSFHSKSMNIKYILPGKMSTQWSWREQRIPGWQWCAGQAERLAGWACIIVWKSTLTSLPNKLISRKLMRNHPTVRLEVPCKTGKLSSNQWWVQGNEDELYWFHCFPHSSSSSVTDWSQILQLHWLVCERHAGYLRMSSVPTVCTWSVGGSVCLGWLESDTPWFNRLVIACVSSDVWHTCPFKWGWIWCVSD